MKKIKNLSFSMCYAFLLSFVSIPVAIAAQPDTKKDTHFVKGVFAETGLNVNACTGNDCNKGKPSGGFDFSLFYKNNKNFAAGVTFHYGMMDPDELEYLRFYNIGIQLRGILPLGKYFESYMLTELGYITLMTAGNNADKDDEHYTFRSTGVTMGLGIGFNYNISNNMQLGLQAKFLFPNWTESCYMNEDGIKCMEPQDSEVNLDVKAYYLMLNFNYTFPQ